MFSTNTCLPLTMSPKSAFFKDILHCGAQAGLELLGSSDPPTLASQAAGAAMCLTTQMFKAIVLVHPFTLKLQVFYIKTNYDNVNVSLFPFNLPTGKYNH
jgi:hypothetical protein